jgi:hypothetical protein
MRNTNRARCSKSLGENTNGEIYRCQKVPNGHMCPDAGCLLVTDEPCPCHCISMSTANGEALYVDWTELKPAEAIITLLDQVKTIVVNNR